MLEIMVGGSQRSYITMDKDDGHSACKIRGSTLMLVSIAARLIEAEIYPAYSSLDCHHL